jgi:hypothetical protein
MARVRLALIVQGADVAKPKLGSGKRFAALEKKVHSGALAAYIGRKKYGAKKFNKLAAKGKK